VAPPLAATTTAERPAPGRTRARGTAEDPGCPVPPAMAAAIKMRLLTAQRGGEVIKMRWQDLDLKTGWWTIPAEDSKNGQAHRVPLVSEAITLLKAQQKERERRQHDEDAPPQDRKAIDYVFVGTGASVRDRAKKAPARVARVLQIEFRGHDLRRTAATKMAEAGVPRQHISAVLNHVEGGARDASVRPLQLRQREACRAQDLGAPAARDPEAPGRRQGAGLWFRQRRGCDRLIRSLFTPAE
jgi:integrase